MRRTLLPLKAPGRLRSTLPQRLLAAGHLGVPWMSKHHPISAFIFTGTSPHMWVQTSPFIKEDTNYIAQGPPYSHSLQCKDLVSE